MKKIILLAIMIPSILFGGACAFNTLRGDRVGDYYFSHTTYTDEVYKIYTPRGWENVLGMYLQDSLDAYEKQGILGKRIEEIEQ